MAKTLNTFNILEEIEVARNNLHKVASEKQINSIEVVHASEKLDILLNRFSKTKYN